MKRFKTNILVRDNRLKDMQNAGLTVNYKILDDSEYQQELKQKLVEESTEALLTTNRHDLVEELSDVMEVFEHLLESSNISMDEIRKIKENKKQKVGGFQQKIKTFSVEMNEDNTEVEYYKNRPNKYPEIL